MQRAGSGDQPLYTGRTQDELEVPLVRTAGVALVKMIAASAITFALLSAILAFLIAYETDFYMEKAFARAKHVHRISDENLKRHSAVSSDQGTLSDLKKKDPRCCSQRIIFTDLYGNIAYLPMIHVMFQNDANDASYLIDIFGDLRGFSGYSRSEGELRLKRSN